MGLTMMRECRVCGVEKSLDEFYAEKSNPEGRQTLCAECVRARARRWGEENHDRKIASMAKWRAENREYRKAYRAANRERELLRKRERYWRDPEAARAKDRAFRLSHPESSRASSARWIQAHPDRVAEYRNSDRYKTMHCERNAAKRSAVTERVDYEAVLAERGMVCHICGEGIDARSDLHFDHVVPLARGGPHTAENIRPSHARCNLAKHARPLEEVASSL
jgi:5-methylcytosine-specific restriction endonuclease McrA